MLSGKKQPSGKFPQGVGKSRDKVAVFTGSSARTLKKIGEVCEAAAAEPEKDQALVAEMDRTGRGRRSRLDALAKHRRVRREHGTRGLPAE